MKKNSIKRYALLILALTIALQPQVTYSGFGWLNNLFALLPTSVTSLPKTIKKNPVPFVLLGAVGTGLLAYYLGYPKNWPWLQQPVKKNDNNERVNEQEKDPEINKAQTEKLPEPDNLKQEQEEKESLKKLDEAKKKIEKEKEKQKKLEEEQQLENEQKLKQQEEQARLEREKQLKLKKEKEEKEQLQKLKEKQELKEKEEKELLENKKKLEKQKEEKQLKEKEVLNESQRKIVETVSQALKKKWWEKTVVEALNKAIYDQDLALLKAICNILPKKDIVRLFTKDITGYGSVFYTTLRKLLNGSNTGLCKACNETIFKERYAQAIGLYFLESGQVEKFGEKYMNIIRFLVKELQLPLNKIQDNSTGELFTYNALAIALQNQYLPLTDYLLTQNVLEIKKENMELPINFKQLFEGLFFSNKGQFYYVPNDFDVEQKLSYTSELVKKFGFYPCFAAIIDHLINNKVDLKTVKVPVLLSEKIGKCSLIAGLLYHMKTNNGGDSRDFGSISIFEIVIKLYEHIGTLGNFEPEKGGNASYYEELEPGLKMLQAYLKLRDPQLEAKFGEKLNKELAEAIKHVGKLRKEKQEEISSSDDEEKEAIEEKPVVKKTSQEEKLYKAIADGDGEKIEKFNVNKSKFTQKERYLKQYDCECPIVLWLLYYLNKHTAKETFPSDKLCDIILKRYNQLKKKNPEIPVTKKHKKKFAKKLQEGFNIVEAYAKKNKLKLENFKDIIPAGALNKNKKK